jgi:CubicO group peptidase (beta-lactamase class C family)
VPNFTEHSKKSLLLLVLFYLDQKSIVLMIVFFLSACGGSGGGGALDDVVNDSRKIASPASSDSQSESDQQIEHWGLSRVSPDSVNLPESAVDKIIDYVFTDAATQSVVVSKGGYVVGERYAEGYDANSVGTSWSVAKSFYSAAIGVAISDGYYSSVGQRASSLLTEFINTDKEEITIEQILRMRSGLAADTNVFFSGDQTAHALANTLRTPPGTAFKYSNANSQLFEPLIRRATGINAHGYLIEKILRPIGIDPINVGLWFDETGSHPMTYCCIDMRADDFLRFGLLYARGGRWQGTQVVPKGYVDASLTPVGFYGYQWWAMNEEYFRRPVRGDIKSAIGLNGQRILIWPEQDIVVVVLTMYQHFANQGYVLNVKGNALNYPNTCKARNNCPAAAEDVSSGNAVPSYDTHALVELIVDLATD